ncbi:hypothetical protein C9374_011343 [Naegleria lovaniensis]|uniref:Bromo domain-containing protein n=1 Tax=Naegleria lovaniensis TaxID=51637 RepID=A0AA88KNY8_NAELO|nr:uncharacterized protein C9374_011343 [Naegleria lovaniensis]KAG2392618.1 hypothetical protein C9374_011343 [Naegleria lovaniensis]
MSSTTSEFIPNDIVSTNDLALLDLYLNEKQKLGSDDEKAIFSALNKSSKIYLEKKYPSRGIKKEVKDLIGDQNIEAVYQDLIKKRLNFLELVEKRLSNCINFIENHQDKELNMKIVEQFVNSFEFITPARELLDSSQKKRKNTEEELDHIQAAASENNESSQPSKQKSTELESAKKKRKFKSKTQKDNTSENISSDTIQQILLSVLQTIEKQNIAESFLHPVDKNIVNYYESILCPMSIADIKKKVTHGDIVSVSELKKTLFLMFQNCIMFSGADFDIHHHAKQLRKLARTLCLEAEQKEVLLKQN